MKLFDKFRKAQAPPDASQIKQYFNRAADDAEHYPSEIDPRIWHVKHVLDHLGDLGDALWAAARTQSIDNAPMLVFATAACAPHIERTASQPRPTVAMAVSPIAQSVTPSPSAVMTPTR